MTECPENVVLMEALEHEEPFKNRGYTATCSSAGPVVVDFQNHVRGVWDFHSGHYFWIDAGYSQPSYRTDSVQSAIDHTLKTIASGIGR